MASSALPRALATAAPVAGPAHLALARALLRLGRFEEAASAYRASVESDPDCAEAHRGLASSLLATKLWLAALPHADRAVALDGADPENWRVLAATLIAAGELAYAAPSLEQALALDPARADDHARLGRVYAALDRPFDAAESFLRALRLDPGDKDSRVNLSSLYGRAGQYAQARAHAEAALALDPDFVGAHQNLAAIADFEGRDEEAHAHRERAYRTSPLFVTRAARPVRRALILASAGRANSPDAYLLPATRYDRLIWFLEYAELATAKLPDYDVVFNAIGDPDAAGATQAKAEAFLASCGRPVLNPPDRIARTRRDLAPALFAGVPGLIVPATWRLSRPPDGRPFGEPAKNMAGQGDPSLTLPQEEGGGPRPLLLRPVGAHGGEGLLRLEAGQAPTIAPGRDHYLTAFHDFRSPDGLYRKYRMFFIEGRAYPYHLAIGEDWLLHYQTSGTSDRPERIAEEARFLEDPRGALGEAAFAAIWEVGRRLELDFAGVDFAVLPDGRALLFEANATMLVHPEAEEGPLAHKNAFVRRICAAFWGRVERVSRPIVLTR